MYSDAMDLRHQLSCTFYSSAFSPCGKYIAAANSFGYIVLFDIDNALRNNSEKWRKSIFVFKAHSGRIHSLVTKENLLISGGTGPVEIWRWNDILDHKPAKISSLNDPCAATESSFLTNEVNALTCCDNKLYAGRDDNLICVWNMETGICEQRLAGHSDYIHGLASIPSTHGIASCSEDGSVKTWDTRTAQAISTFEPHLEKQLRRSQNGKWLSCVSLSENGQWMACGGGPQLSLWHLRSQTHIAQLGKGDFIPYAVEFKDELVLSGGTGKKIHHWHTNGEEKASIPCSIGVVFSLASCEKQNVASAAMIAAGTSNKLDVFSNLNYRSHILQV